MDKSQSRICEKTDYLERRKNNLLYLEGIKYNDYTGHAFPSV